MSSDNSADSTTRETIEPGRRGAATVSQAIHNGIGAVQQYVQDRGLNLDPRDFARREPWLAIAAAFAVGYVAAQIVRRFS